MVKIQTRVTRTVRALTALALVMHVARVAVLAALWTVTLSPTHVLAQNAREPAPLVVGAWDAPPFFIKTTDHRWEGLSVDLWRAVAAELGWRYELREYDSLGLLLKAAEAGEVDVLPGVAASASREVALDLSHSCFPRSHWD